MFVNCEYVCPRCNCYWEEENECFHNSECSDCNLSDIEPMEWLSTNCYKVMKRRNGLLRPLYSTLIDHYPEDGTPVTAPGETRIFFYTTFGWDLDREHYCTEFNGETENREIWRIAVSDLVKLCNLFLFQRIYNNEEQEYYWQNAVKFDIESASSCNPNYLAYTAKTIKLIERML